MCLYIIGVNDNDKELLKFTLEILITKTLFFKPENSLN